MATKKAGARSKTKKAVKSSVSETAQVSPRLPNVLRLTKTSAVVLWRSKKVLGGVILIYGLLNLMLVQGLAAATDVVSLKDQLNQVFTGNFGQLASSFSIFLVLVGSAGNGSSPTAGAYQLILGLIASLAIIWALRQIFAGTQIRIRDAYYNGMTPLIPFILVLLIIGVQLMPMLVGSTVYSIVMANGIAVHVIEQISWFALFIILTLTSLYMISSSLIALYIVTLQDMTPIKALRSAKNLVRGRRWEVMRKLLFLPFILLIVAAVIMLPIIIALTPLAQWAFFVLTMFSLLAIHTYMYTLYRELLNE